MDEQIALTECDPACSEKPERFAGFRRHSVPNRAQGKSDR
jgi:hypothetical protein